LAGDVDLVVHVVAALFGGPEPDARFRGDGLGDAMGPSCNELGSLGHGHGPEECKSKAASRRA
jgi:hypothetical protein